MGVRSFMSGYVLGAIVTIFVHSVTAEAGDPFTELRATAYHIVQTGSGSIVKAPTGHKYLLTNWHVCKHLHGGKFGVNNEVRAFFVGKIAKSSPYVDLCALEVDQRFGALEVGTKLDIATVLYTRGYPNGYVRESQGTILGEEDIWLNMAPLDKCPPEFKEERNALGNMSGCIYHYHTAITTLYSAHGASGSAVVDEDGKLVGVMQTSAGAGENGGIIMLSVVNEFLKGL